MEELRAALIEKGPPKKKLFSRDQVLIIVALAIVIFGVYGALMVSARQKRVSTPIAAEPARSGRLELQVAHEQAQAWAVGWQSDAQLVGAGTRWQLTGGDRLTPYRPSWSFRFYSPAAGQVQTLTVGQAGAQPVRQVAVSKAPVPVEADWSLDSDDLFYTFMAYGGDEFIREHSHTNLHFSLSGQDAGPSIWTLSAIDPEAQQSFVVGVDALSRKVVLTG